jgi:negative regulator of sigma E activity
MKKKVTMMNKNTYLNEEHIVAYLDGELNVTGREVKTALAQDKELAQAALEYHAMAKAFARSASDDRFMLTAEADKLAMAALRKELAKKTLVDAPASRPSRTAIPMLKQMWFRRTSVGVAFALLLGVVWFTFPKNDIMVEPTVATNQVQPAVIPAPIASVETPTAADVTIPSTQTKSVGVKTTRKNVITTSTEKAPVANQNIAQKTSTEEVSAPGDVMISRRYAKLVKATPVIEITQQDKIADKM